MASDMRLNDKPIAKDGAYIYAETADGSQVKISKADLAAVVAEQIYTIANKKILAEGDDLNNISDGKYCYINGHNPNNSTGDNVTVYQFTTHGRSEDKYQIAFDRNNLCVKARLFTGTNWTEWKTVFSFS